MQLHDLKVFKTIYETGSINKTAQILGFAQSNITARLKVLENEFSTSFFHRSPKGVFPTKSGKIFYDYAIVVLSKTEQVAEQLAQKNSVKHVLLTEMLFQYLVTDKHIFPLSEFQFDIKKSYEIINEQELSQEIIVTYYPVTNSNYLLKEVGKIDLVFEYSTKYHTDDSLPLLVNSDEHCPFRKKTLELVSNETKIIEIDSYSNIIDLVEKNQGYALLPTFIEKNHEVKSLTSTTPIPIEFYVYYRK